MIFVTTGTVGISFKRLVDASLTIFGNTNEKLIIQSGVYKLNTPYKNVVIKDFFSYEETINLYKKADLIISATGEASVFLILHYSKNGPIFFPRLKKFTEHVDNQQLLIAECIQKNNLAKVAYDIDQLKELVKTKKKKLITTKHAADTPNKLIALLHKITAG